jgi:hypothetical protein
MSVATGFVLNGPGQPSAAAIMTSSVSGWLAVLQEDDPILQEKALQHLLQCVDTQWHEMAHVLPDIEAMAEEDGGAGSGTNNNNQTTAAALASRIFYYLQEPQSALRMALIGKVTFQHEQDSYTTTMIQTALDAYVKFRRRARDADGTNSGTTPAKKTTTTSSSKKDREAIMEGLSEEQLQPLVQQFMDQACRAKLFKEAIGICLEAHWLDELKVILSQQPSAHLVLYTWDCAIADTAW